MNVALKRITVNIPCDLKNQLTIYVEQKVIPSITSGINRAICIYLKELKKQAYIKAMKEASSDPEFLRRTMETHKFYDSYAEDLLGE